MEKRRRRRGTGRPSTIITGGGVGTKKRKRMGLLRVFICNDRRTLKLGAKTEISQTTLLMIVK